MPTETIAPAIIALPLCALAMAIVTIHVLTLQSSDAPASRKRIRTAAGLLMLLLCPALCYALAIATPATTADGGNAHTARTFILSWTVVLGLVVMVLGLAMFDIVNNLRLAGDHRRALNCERAAEILAAAQASLAARGSGERPQLQATPQIVVIDRTGSHQRQ